MTPLLVPFVRPVGNVVDLAGELRNFGLHRDRVRCRGGAVGGPN